MASFRRTYPRLLTPPDLLPWKSEAPLCAPSEVEKIQTKPRMHQLIPPTLDWESAQDVLFYCAWRCLWGIWSYFRKRCKEKVTWSLRAAEMQYRSTDEEENKGLWGCLVWLITRVFFPLVSFSAIDIFFDGWKWIVCQLFENRWLSVEWRLQHFSRCKQHLDLSFKICERCKTQHSSWNNPVFT